MNTRKSDCFRQLLPVSHPLHRVQALRLTNRLANQNSTSNFMTIIVVTAVAISVPQFAAYKVKSHRSYLIDTADSPWRPLPGK